MAGTETMSGDIVVFNRGIRNYTTSWGILKPQTSITLPEKEAKGLLDYTDVINFSKVSPDASAKIEELKKENAELKAKVEQHAPKLEKQAPKSEPKESTAKKRKK